MEWPTNVNSYLHDVITKVDHTLIPPGVTGDVRTIRLVQDSLQRVIDNIGRASATAQGLSKMITTADKMRKAPTHILYLLKDADAKGGSGEVIGMLKMGRKHLYLYDEGGRAHEAEPLCVLDFYVVDERQRTGLGRKLFDHMLRDQHATPAALAIDGPSAKMENFLIKNYGIGRLIRQNNNFSVCPEFFNTSADVISAAGSTAPPKPAAIGRFAAHKPHSAIASVIHGTEPEGSSGAANGEAEPAAAGPEPAPEPEPLAVEQVTTPVQAQATDGAGEENSPAAVKRPQWLGLGETPGSGATSPPAPPAGSASLERRDSQLTTQGYFDVKFYHNKLW